MTVPAGESARPPFMQQRDFWVLMGFAVLLGVLGAFAGLIFMGVIGVGNNWYTDTNPDWFGGHWWWVAVTAATGIAVGVLRRLTRLPEEMPGLIADLTEAHVDPRLVPGVVLVSAVSLSGGASLLRRFALSICFLGKTRTLDSHASRLRQKLDRHSDAGWIVNVWSVGYRLFRPPERCECGHAP